MHHPSWSFFFFFNDTATTEIYTLSLHDALPISPAGVDCRHPPFRAPPLASARRADRARRQHSAHRGRSEEHTSELQSPCNLVCRLLLEKKKRNADRISTCELLAELIKSSTQHYS